jgi:acyl transferase domain-containing protein
MNTSQTTGLEIAIIGMNGRFPGANNIDELWDNLSAGVESIERFTTETVLENGVEPHFAHDPAYVKASGTLNDIDLFDAAFFGYSPREAEIIDPQHRLFLECAHSALETAGYHPQNYAHPIGVYTTLSGNDYLLHNLYPNSQLIEAVGGDAILMANGNYLSTVISYKLQLTGASITVQTACSSSLVAIHLACQGLLSGDCEMALAGGVSIRLPQRTGYLYQPGGILSSDGHCRAFDAAASGAVAGDGVGVVILKRLETAIADRDNILAVIKGSAINNDGAAKIGYTAPSVTGQAAVIQAAQATAEITADSISYIEAHGTGTALGDPIEITALTQAFRASTDLQGFCAIGSLKSNIGHLDAAAGVASLIKTTLALQHQQIPPSLHFTTPNPQIDWSNSPFVVPTQLTSWPETAAPRRAGVSSFGIGGTNAHIILEQAPTPQPSSAGRPWQLILLSAKNESALATQAKNLAAYLEQQPAVNLADVAATLQQGRGAYRYRQMVVCQTVPETIAALQQPNAVVDAGTSNRPVAFLLPGQGSQYVGMGKQLYDTEPVVRSTIDHCAEILQPLIGLDLRQLLYPASADAAAATTQLEQTQFAQVALFTLEYAIAQLWQSWGVQPQALLGHSIGEYVAACLAGVFDLPTALALVAKRGFLMQSLPPGAMLTVPLGADQLRPQLGEQLSIAAINTPQSCVVAGPPAAVTDLEQKLTAQGHTCRVLHTSHAFHSPQMQPIAATFAAYVATISLQPPQIPYLSNVTGTWITADAATDPQYWADHLCQTVQFAAGASVLMAHGDYIYLEVGSGNTLSHLLGQQSTLSKPLTIATLRHPRDQRDDLALSTQSLGQLWLAGGRVDWAGYHHDQQRQRLLLPTYPFQRQRYWVDANSQPEIRTPRPVSSDLSSSFYLPSWQRSLSPVATPPTTAQLLIFLDQLGWGIALADQLRQAGLRVTTVQAGEQWQQQSPDAYIINYQQQPDYSLLCQQIDSPTHIVHLASLAANREKNVDQAQQQGFYSLLWLTAALGDRPVQMTVITSGTQQVTGADWIDPATAMLQGLLPVISQEYPQMACRAIDIDHLVPNLRRLDQIMAEIWQPIEERIIAYRGNQRWLPTFTPTPLATAALPLRDDGWYLITGGLGKIGLALALSLAQQQPCRLLLTTRSPFPDRSQWPEKCAKNSGQADHYQIQQLQEIEQLGTQILVIQADVSSEAQMTTAIQQASERFGQIHGVFHTAAVTSGSSFGLIAQITASDCAIQFQPKIQGLQVLDRLLGNQALDFCLLFSSLSAILGGVGFAAYAAANAYMDAYCQQYRPDRYRPWTAVNWDGWQFAAGSDQALTVSSGLAACARILAQPALPQWVVATGNFIERQLLPAQQQIYQHPRPALATAYVAPTNELEQTIATVWQTVLGIETIGIHDNFFDLGGNSLTAIQIISRLRERSLDVPVNEILANPTIWHTAKSVMESIDVATLEQAIAEIETLSEAEVEQLLAN